MGVKKEGEKLMRVNGHNLLNLGENECGRGKVEKEVNSGGFNESGKERIHHSRKKNKNKNKKEE